ncbi:MAG: 4-hydroxy-tetrahydrodipicolinate synthase [Holosporaceae bacterium]|jgi:4-hydroxy-tetrahydrodipicolinate synthase|nr:4-hydroxy-tetrahydrodipicolinate synthase [Holosporaceae bacterium]
MFHGYFAAVATPFSGGAIDFSAFERYMLYIANSGVSGAVVGACTGEAISLSVDEKIELSSVAAKTVSGKIKIIAGVMETTTNGCLELIKNLEKHVDGFLCICPYFVKPSSEQTYLHLHRLSSSTTRSIIIYNNPLRTCSKIDFDTLQKLAELNNVVAIKDCSSDISVFTSWRTRLKENFAFLSGIDNAACGALAMGADGVVSVSANIMPEMCVKLYNSFRKGDMERFAPLRDMLHPLHELMFAAPSPAPAKYALSKMGYMSDELRAPLTTIDQDLRAKIDDFLKKAALI